MKSSCYGNSKSQEHGSASLLSLIFVHILTQITLVLLLYQSSVDSHAMTLPYISTLLTLLFPQSSPFWEADPLSWASGSSPGKSFQMIP